MPESAFAPRLTHWLRPAYLAAIMQSSFRSLFLASLLVLPSLTQAAPVAKQPLQAQEVKHLAAQQDASGQVSDVEGGGALSLVNTLLTLVAAAAGAYLVYKAVDKD